MILWRDPWALLDSPENNELYGPPNPTDPDFQALIESVKRDGVREPILVTLDGWIVSGHRRKAAACEAGLESVPVRLADYRREDQPERHLRELREHNRQRVKTRDEAMREALLDVSPEAAHAELVEHRKAQARVSTPALELRRPRWRARISRAKQPFLAAVLEVVHAREHYWPLSVRAVHYALLNDPPLIHAGKPESRYRNDRRGYSALTDLVARARLARKLPWHAIHDPTRPVTIWDTWKNPAPYVRAQLHSLFKGYARNLLQSEPNHIELICEKNTVEPLLREVAADFTVPLTSGRGYCSLEPRHAIAQRFEESGREKLILLIVSDFDPEGEDIAESFARSLRDDFHITDVHALKVALTPQQVREHKLVPMMRAKKASSRYAGFAAKHGDDVFELEALEPSALQRIVREAIESVIDVKAFSAEQAAEREDARYLAALRMRVLGELRDVLTESNNE